MFADRPALSVILRSLAEYLGRSERHCGVEAVLFLSPEMSGAR